MGVQANHIRRSSASYKETSRAWWHMTWEMLGKAETMIGSDMPGTSSRILKMDVSVKSAQAFAQTLPRDAKSSLEAA